MPRSERRQKAPAIRPDCAHLPLLRSLALTITQLLPEHMCFTLVTFNREGHLQDYISSHQPARHAPQQKKLRRRFA
jgi:hypothetical protein